MDLDLNKLKVEPNIKYREYWMYFECIKVERKQKALSYFAHPFYSMRIVFQERELKHFFKNSIDFNVVYIGFTSVRIFYSML
jgi:hypothetical protein